MQWFTGRSQRLSGLLIGIIGFFGGLALGLMFMAAEQGLSAGAWISRFVQIGTAAIAGALVALALMDWILRRYILIEEAPVNDDLIAALRTPGEEAQAAAHILEEVARLKDGSLRGKNFTGAHLSGIRLKQADLEGARLR